MTATKTFFALLTACGMHAAGAQAPANNHWRGDFIYFADAAQFTDCASGKRWPVAMVGDMVALQRSYLKWQKAPATPLLVNFDGRLEVREAMEGPPREQIVVERFGSVEPGSDCATLAAAKGSVTARPGGN